MTFNKFGVDVDDAGAIVIGNAPLQARRRPGAEMPDWPAVAPLSPDEAINLAAWLVAKAGADRARFLELLDLVVPG